MLNNDFKSENIDVWGCKLAIVFKDFSIKKLNDKVSFSNHTQIAPHCFDRVNKIQNRSQTAENWVLRTCFSFMSALRVLIDFFVSSGILVCLVDLILLVFTVFIITYRLVSVWIRFLFQLLWKINAFNHLQKVFWC